MGLTTGIFGIILIISAGHGFYLLEGEDAEATITWPTEYSFKAENIDVINGRVELCEVWYSAEHNKSRVDYFDGINKKFYVAPTGEEFGYIYNVFTVANKNLENIVMCQESGTQDPQKDFMPELDGFRFEEDTVLDSKKVQVWKSEHEDEDGENRLEKVLYIYKTEYDFDIPLKLVGKAYEIAKGELAAYNIINYKSFGYTITEEDVSVNNDVDCEYDGVMGKDFKQDIKYLHPYIPGDLDIAFRSFKRYHNKKYNKKEHDQRIQIFHDNWKYVHEHNSKNLGYTLELNKFADMSDEEFGVVTGTVPTDPMVQGSIPFPHSVEKLAAMEEELPDTVDLRLDGYMRPIRNQGGCGSCWAFSTTAAVEGALSRSNGGRNIDLSEQSLVDCAWGYENYGCRGGLIDHAFRYIEENGIPTEHDYGQYLELDGVCHVPNMTETFGIKGFSRVTVGNPIAMKATLHQYGPVTVGLYAGRNMKFYSSGILYDIDCDEEDSTPNHGVTVVGYGTRDGTPYWIVRNSWGETWGEDGYMLISAVNDNCKVLGTAFFPIV
ncbi:hypothetical protein ACJJTC_014954 [Scirpophaga incertulas]